MAKQIEGFVPIGLDDDKWLPLDEMIEALSKLSESDQAILRGLSANGEGEDGGRD